MRVLAGNKFGRLTVLEPTTTHQSHSIVWRCLCECGTITNVSATNLRAGNSRSCGCLRRELVAAKNTTHGDAPRGHETREYRAWRAMLDRCQRPSNDRFQRYGGRGINVWEQWHQFATFRSDMGPCPPRHSLERIENDGNYEPGNVRWATTREQARNRSVNRWLTHDGITLCLSDWSARTGLKWTTIAQRLKRGWSIDRALSAPASHAETS